MADTPPDRPLPHDERPQPPDSESPPESAPPATTSSSAPPGQQPDKKSHLRFFRVDRSKGPGRTELEVIPDEETDALLKSALAEREKKQQTPGGP